MNATPPTKKIRLVLAEDQPGILVQQQRLLEPFAQLDLVGTARDGRRALELVREAKNEGRTVLFVSHALPAIEQLCNTCAVLDHGQLLVKEDNVEDAIARYSRLLEA